MKFNFNPLLSIGKKILFDEAAKIGSRVLEDKIDHVAKKKKFQIRRMAFHGAKKGAPVYAAGILSKIILFHFPQYGFDQIAIIAVLSALIFVVINILKKKFGVTMKGFL